jgi:hypothetical protein
MKTKFTLTVLCLMLSLMVLAEPPKKGPKRGNSNSNEVSLEKILKNIHKAFEQALNAPAPTEQYKNAGNVLTYLTQVDVSFENAVAKEVGAELSLFVKVGGKRSKEKARSVAYSFVPRKGQKVDTKDVAVQAYSDLYYDLLSIGTCLEKYRNLPYQLKEIELELSLKIVKSGEVGVEFKIITAEAGVSGSIEKSQGHTITLKFELPDDFFSPAASTK